MIKDTLNGLLIGFLVAVCVFFIKLSGNVPQLNTIPFFTSILFVLPILSAFGIALSAFLGKKIPIVFQGAKFLLVGALNTLIDLGVLNILIAITDISSGIGFSLFKGVSFISAVFNSYLWNKHWTFGITQEIEQNFIGKGREFAQFFIVSGIGFLLNVGIASFIVNGIGPRFGISEITWPTVGALTATILVLIWNFLGYKLIVFKR